MAESVSLDLRAEVRARTTQSSNTGRYVDPEAKE